jgi:hypothetical protein
MPETVRILPGAEHDIAEAFEWYEMHRRGLGYDFLRQVKDCVDSIALHPESYDPIMVAFGEPSCADFRRCSFTSSEMARSPYLLSSMRLEIRGRVSRSEDLAIATYEWVGFNVNWSVAVGRGNRAACAG